MSAFLPLRFFGIFTNWWISTNIHHTVGQDRLTHLIALLLESNNNPPLKGCNIFNKLVLLFIEKLYTKITLDKIRDQNI